MVWVASPTHCAVCSTNRTASPPEYADIGDDFVSHAGQGKAVTAGSR